MTSFTLALDGYSQIRMEKIFDNYKTRFIDGRSSEEQASRMQKIQKALQAYQKNTRVSEIGKMMFAYLSHLFCEAESIVDGMVCRDNYVTDSTLTTSKDTLTLSNIRTILIAEHSKRRIDRGLSILTESNTLNNIAQNYANALCTAGYISHELNGSTLEQRYKDGGYAYDIGGENLWSGQVNIAQILDQLTTSIHHRDNMYEPDFREIGVGQCQDIWVINYGTQQ